MAGPATDNSAGIDYIKEHFDEQALNARTAPDLLGNLISDKLFGRLTRTTDNSRPAQR